MTATPVEQPTEHLLRELAPPVLGAVVRRFRDFAAAEDAVQEASLAAAIQWPREGVPKSCHSRRHGLAADPGTLQSAQADVRQPNGRAQSRDRGGDGARREEGF